MKLQADGHRRETTLHVGQRVWLATTHLPLKVGTRKLTAKWAGPFTITQQVSSEAWKVHLPATWRIHDVYHSSQLKAVVGNPRVPEPIALDTGEAAVEFEVERLVGRRQVRGQGVQYLVRWKGYGAHEDTWEPLTNLANAGRLVKEFEKKTRKTSVV